jgi:hypothetical protein
VEIHRALRPATHPEGRIHTTDGQTIAAIYVRRGDVEFVVVPADATRWEEAAAARMVMDRAAGSAYAMIMLDELPPQPVPV